MDDVDNLIRVADGLLLEMKRNSNNWDELRLRIQPRFDGKARLDDIAGTGQMSSAGKFSAVAHKAMLNLASAHLMFITPMDAKWFSLKSRNEHDEYSANDDWYSKATEAVSRALADSNFYSTAHEVYLDRCLTGTGCMFCDINNDGGLQFEHVPTGTYGIAEGARGDVNTLVRVLKFTGAQAVEQFGYDVLPNIIQRAYDSVERRYTDRFEFLHVVTPNDKARFGSSMLAPDQRKWRDVYIARDEKKIVYNGGFYEFPFLVTRFLKGSLGAFGEAPGASVLPEIRECLLMDRIMDIAGSRLAIPSVIVAAELAGEVDLRAGGKTVVPDHLLNANVPRTFAEVGDVRFLLERQQGKEETIRQAFFNDILQVVSNVDRQMTATEVNARESERIVSFFSSFIQFSSDFQVMMKRIVGLMFRNTDGAVLPPHPPKELFQVSADGQQVEVKCPRTRYVGKIAQAFDRMQRAGLDGVLDWLAKFVQITQDGSVLQRLKPWEILRFIWDASGAPMRCIASASENEEITAREQEQAQQAQQAQLAEQESNANVNNANAQKAQAEAQAVARPQIM